MVDGRVTAIRLVRIVLHAREPAYLRRGAPVLCRGYADEEERTKRIGRAQCGARGRRGWGVGRENFATGCAVFRIQKEGCATQYTPCTSDCVYKLRFNVYTVQYTDIRRAMHVLGNLLT